MVKKTNPLIHFGFKQSVLNPVIHFGFESIYLGLSYEDSVLPQGPTEGSQHNSFYSRINITQWGSEYQTSLVFEIEKVVLTLNGEVFKWGLKTAPVFRCVD